MTWRAHTLRLTADDLAVYLGLDVAMGDFIDQPITEWDEMFLPLKLEEILRRVTVVRPGGEQPLVKSERVLVTDNRLPPREQPPERVGLFALFGVAGGGVLLGLGARGRRRRVGRRGLLVALGSRGLAAGLLGCIFTLLWLFTDHAVAYHNENILQLGPWALALPVLALRAGGRPWALHGLRLAVAAAAAASLLGLLLKPLPAFDQDNYRIIALLLPTWLGALGGAVLLTTTSRRAVSRPSGSLLRP